MQTTAYGYRIPESGDYAKNAGGWMQAIEFNFERLDEHDHDGVNSPSLAINAFAPYTSVIAAADWVVSGVTYRQLVTVPASITEIDDFHIEFIHTAPGGAVGQRARLDVVRNDATHYYVYCNDNTAAFTAVYR